MAKVSDLPNELLRYLFQMLSSEDRKVALLVDRMWRRVGEDPVLWKWCIIKIMNGQDLNKLSVGRFKYVQQIDVYSVLNWQALEKLFQASLELPKLKEIKGVKMLDQSLVNSELLGRALGKLGNLDLNGNNITTDQIVAIFKEMAEKGCTKKLTLDYCSLLELEAEILSTVMSGLQQFKINQVSLTSDQVCSIFKSISENNQLKKVVLQSLDVSSVRPELFGTAVTNIESVSLSGMQISHYQTRALFSQMGQNKKIKKFSARLNLLSADPKLIARGLSKLEEVRLYTSALTDGQLQAIFTELNQNCKLKVLEFRWNDLFSVHPVDLSEVVNKIEEVDMSWCQLNEEQITAVLTRAQQNTKLKRLDISNNDLSFVHPDVLSEVVNKIEVLGMSLCHLSEEQITAVLTRAQQNTKLKSLDITDNDLSSVHPDVLSEVVNTIEVVGMNLCNLSEEQITAVLTRAQPNTKLKSLDITNNDISQVDPIILATAEELIEDFYTDNDEELYNDIGQAVDVDSDGDEGCDEDERLD